MVSVLLNLSNHRTQHSCPQNKKVVFNEDHPLPKEMCTVPSNPTKLLTATSSSARTVQVLHLAKICIEFVSSTVPYMTLEGYEILYLVSNYCTQLTNQYAAFNIHRCY